MSESFKGLRDTDEVEKKTSELRSVREVKDAIRDEQQQIKKQRDLEGQIGGLISALDRTSLPDNSRAQESSAEGNSADEVSNAESRLLAQLADLRKQAARAEASGERRVARRVLDGVFIGLFEQGTNLLQTQKRYAEAVRTFKLATEVNPDRAGAFFYLAWSYAASGNRRKALQALQTAVDKGFSDLSAITGNKAFDGIRDETQYRQIIQALQSKH